MSKQAKKGLLPERRFPEFCGKGEWEKKSLAPYIEQYIERVSSDTELEVYSSTREGLKPQSEYYDGRNLLNNGEYGVVPAGCFVYRHMSDDNVFKFNLNQLNRKIAVSKEYPVFKAVNLDERFLLHTLNDGAEFKKFAASQKKGGTRTRLYFKALSTFECFLPPFEEQQKIADCLASICELITAQSQKIDTLKAHKKGLMRQLFPAQGETVPRCRFPEFRDKGEWVVESLGQLASYENGKAYEQNILEEGRFVVVNSRFISTDGVVRKYSNADFCIANAGDVLMVLSDLPKGKALAKCYFVEVNNRYAVNQRVCRLKAGRVDEKFLFYILNRNTHGSRKN